MDDTISRLAAIDALRVAYFDNNIQSAKDDPCIVDAMTDWAIRQVKALPSAQPQIIRCIDCNYACIDPERESDEIYCSENDFWKDDDFYCGYAERRTDG